MCLMYIKQLPLLQSRSPAYRRFRPVRSRRWRWRILRIWTREQVRWIHSLLQNKKSRWLGVQLTGSGNNTHDTQRDA